MARSSVGLVWGLLALVSLSCEHRTVQPVSAPDAGVDARKRAAEPDAEPARQPVDGGPCLTCPGRCPGAERDPMGCAACARARVPGLTCVDGVCQQKRCTGPVSFRRIASYTTMLSPASTLLPADVDRDGRLDLLEFTYEPGEPAVWLGRGDGTFAVSTSYPTAGTFATPNLPGYAAVGDFNEDGLADLVVSDSSDISQVWIRPGLPGGGFGGRPGTPLPRQWMADVDGDCHLDFVTVNNTTDEGISLIMVLRGRGDGTWASPRTFATSGGAALSSILDWDGDGILDILLDGPVLHFLHGNGDGSFADGQRCAVGGGNATTTYVDLNQDGRLDLLWAPWRTTRVATIFGQGGCNFSPRTDYVLPFEAMDMALGDLDGDGLPDPLATGQDPKTGLGLPPVLLTGSADGKFTRAPELSIDQSDLDRVFVADVNGDGRADLVRTGSTGTFEVFANTCE